MGNGVLRVFFRSKLLLSKRHNTEHFFVKTTQHNKQASNLETLHIDCANERRATVIMHKCVAAFFFERAVRTLGLTGRARPSGQDERVTSQTVVVRVSGALFYTSRLFFCFICGGVYDVHCCKYVECIRKGLGCAIAAGEGSNCIV